mmetsp:Transcript_22807/g.35716  ORF Transcript_22807/g.35716 Transcript_22807/m.35716 type:complete len:132 (-) Transcript_22807:1078-1473(-)
MHMPNLMPLSSSSIAGYLLLWLAFFVQAWGALNPPTSSAQAPSLRSLEDCKPADERDWFAYATAQVQSVDCTHPFGFTAPSAALRLRGGWSRAQMIRQAETRAKKKQKREARTKAKAKKEEAKKEKQDMEE